MKSALLDLMTSLSSLTSISSRSSLETYESLKNDIPKVSTSDLQELVRGAEKIINEKFAPDPQHIYTYRKGDETLSVNLDRVMSAMLENSEGCGGDDAKRYVASAIVACGRRENAVETLAALSATWLTHLLFIFKTSRSQPNQEPHELATPTLHVGEGVDHRIGSFTDDVKMRDGYKCILTGYQDIDHPLPNENTPSVFLRACHIFQGAVDEYDEDPKSDSSISASTTSDILANYTRLPKETFEDLRNHLDDASNGMMLQTDARDAFDRFSWCLKATSTANVYTVKIFKNAGILRLPPGNLVTFRDQSNDFILSSTCLRRNRDIPLPNPRYLAIHAAIAGIFHASAAGKFFDELLDRYKDDEGKIPPVRSWTELEKLMEEGVLRDSVRALQLGVH